MITAEQVQKLREKSGAGIMDCKRALESSNGDYGKAVQFLREKGKMSAAERAGRSTGQGLVCSWISKDLKRGSAVQVNCETDFVARTQEFQEFAAALARRAGESVAQDAGLLLTQKFNGSETVESAVKEKIGKLGENIQVKKAASLGGSGPGAVVGRYVHAPAQGAPDCGSLAVLLDLKSDKDTPEIQNLLKELCMQVAAASPKWISKEDVPASIVEKEKEIYKEQCRQSGKPEKAWDKIIAGKLTDFYRQFCLLEQSHVRDPSGKTSVKSLLAAAAEKTGQALAVKKFVRFKMGEE